MCHTLVLQFNIYNMYINTLCDHDKRYNHSILKVYTTDNKSEHFKIVICTRNRKQLLKAY